MDKPPTAIQLFGPAPWVTDPAPIAASPSGIPINFNPIQFATAATAALLCAIVEAGCRLPKGNCIVVQQNACTPFGPFHQNQPNEMLFFVPDGSLHNAGLIAKWFDDILNLPDLDKAFTEEFGVPFQFVMPPAKT